ncbi:MAG: cyclic nucleotide-binding domain-containing protein [Sedimentisphaerales bacterium]|nr:cyclic nucleotide-binding domain-containing protein [Sedimentisphaerales bacterium]
MITDQGVRIRLQRTKPFGRVWPVNLNETGVCIRMRLCVQKEQWLEMQLELGDEEPLYIPGQVEWVREDPAGGIYYCQIRFANLNAHQSQKIRAYMETGTESLAAFFSHFPLFEKFSPQDCRRLLGIVTLRELPKKDFLYMQGSNDLDVQGLFIVCAGLLSIYRGRKFKPERQLTVVSPGEIFGEFSLLHGRAHSSTVLAINDTVLVQINKEGYEMMRLDDPSVALKVMEAAARSLSDRLNRATQRLFCPARI